MAERIVCVRLTSPGMFINSRISASGLCPAIVFTSNSFMMHLVWTQTHVSLAHINVVRPDSSADLRFR